MKTLIVIWLAATISGIGTVTYVNHQIDLAVQPAYGLQETIDGSELQPANGLKVETYNPQQTINASELQGGR